MSFNFELTSFLRHRKESFHKHPSKIDDNDLPNDERQDFARNYIGMIIGGCLVELPQGFGDCLSADFLPFDELLENFLEAQFFGEGCTFEGTNDRTRLMKRNMPARKPLTVESVTPSLDRCNVRWWNSR